jgi:hypothetical protein
VTGPLYRWPQAAEFGRVIPKSKFYENGRVSTAVREKFVAEVQRITWAYKLSEETVNLAGTDKFKEIQVLHVEAKSEKISDAVLAAVDTAVKTPTIFEITIGTGSARLIRMAMTPKRAGSARESTGCYYSTDWFSESAARIPLPTVTNLTGLYMAILDALVPIAIHPGEYLSDVMDRLRTMRTLEREISSTEGKLRNEVQLNRKVELRQALKLQKTTLRNIVGPQLNRHRALGTEESNG